MKNDSRKMAHQFLSIHFQKSFYTESMGDRMKRLFPLFTILCFAVFLSADARPQSPDLEIAIIGATVVDGTGAEPRDRTVVIRGDRILTVGPQEGIPSAARVIDAKGMTLIPGLFDLHTHLPYT